MGGTYEPIDPIRGITNKSSGKMGLELAKQAYTYLRYGRWFCRSPKLVKMNPILLFCKISWTLLICNNKLKLINIKTLLAFLE